MAPPPSWDAEAGLLPRGEAADLVSALETETDPARVRALLLRKMELDR